jgi:hypothetical protein
MMSRELTKQIYTACVFCDLSSYLLHLAALQFFILKFLANSCYLHQNTLCAINYKNVSVVLVTIPENICSSFSSYTETN